MSFQQAVTQAVQSLTQMRALFGTDAAPGSGASDGAASLRQAQAQTTTAGLRMTSQSGQVADVHQALITRANAGLDAAAGNDGALHKLLVQAAAIDRAGAARMDDLVARARAAAAAAAGARTPAAQRASLTGLHGLMSEGQGVVNGAKTLAGGVAGEIRALDYGFKQSPGTEPPKVTDEDKRKRNQIDAFRKVFGRDPVSKSDWTTAANLDPHTYDPKNGGQNAEVRVVRIRPVPGQGVVRSSQFIPDRNVASGPGSYDLGDNRGPNPNFDPENSRVTMTIDYDNGLVVMRQNPSVKENSAGGPGEALAGIPTGSVTQTADGAVRIKYDAGNPFAPEITRDPTGLMQGHLITANGDLVFTPWAQGVQVGGTRTDYPTLEVYQDMPNGTSHTVAIDDAAHGGPWGPLTNLPRHHDIGTGGKAFAPFDTGSWNPRFDVPAPLPGTSFGTVDQVPSVPPLPTGGAHQF